MKTLGKIFMGIVYAVLYAPLLVMVVFSFNSARSTTIFGGFSLRWYNVLFEDFDMGDVLMNTLNIAIWAAVVATVLGVIAAYGIYRIRSKKLKSAFNTVTNVPLTNPDIITGVSLMMLFTFFGALVLRRTEILGFWTLLIAHITFNLPYVILSVQPKLTQMDPNLTKAAMDLGCTPVQAFFKVVLHEIFPGIVSGALMAFTMSLDDFVISYFVYGPNFVTLPVEIYNYTKKPLHPKIYALFTLLFLAILLVMLLMNILQARDTARHRNPRLKTQAGGTTM